MHCTAMQLIERLGPRLFFKKFHDRDNAITSFAFQVKIPACFLNLRPLIWMSLTLWSNFTTKSVLQLNLLAIACLYYWYIYLYIYQYQYLYLPLWSMTLCPPVRVRTWKKRFSHQTHLHACPLFKIKSNIEPHFNLQSSKPVKIKN